MNIIKISKLLAVSRFVRVVKEMDLKSIGLARAGSNPADDAFLLFHFLHVVEATENILNMLKLIKEF